MTNNIGLEIGIAMMLVGMPAMIGLGPKLASWTARPVAIGVLACGAVVTLLAASSVLEHRVAVIVAIPCFHLLANKAFRMAWKSIVGRELPGLPSRMSDRIAFGLLLLALTWPPILWLAWLDRHGLLDSPHLLAFPP